MSHVAYEWVMSHMHESHINESCQVWISHVTYAWVMSHINESRHVWMSHATYAWVTSHIKQSRHVWMSHVTRCVLLLLLPLSNGKEWHIWRSHGTHKYMSRYLAAGADTYEGCHSLPHDSCIYVCHDSITCVILCRLHLVKAKCNAWVIWLMHYT